MKFNQTNGDSNRTVNYEGGEAFEPATPELGLYKVVVNNLLEDTYYEDDRESLRELGERFVAAADEDPEFPLQLAAYARREMYLRQVPQVLLVLAAQHDEAKGHVREYAPRVIDMVDLASYGDLVTPEGYEGVFNVSGWNGRIVDFVTYAEDGDEVIDEIRAY